MPSVLVNTAGRGLTRGLPSNLGTLIAAASVVQFALEAPRNSPNGLDILFIVTVGGTATPALEASIDGGTTWFQLTPWSTATAVGFLGSLPVAAANNGDTAVSSASKYDVSGLSGALFRFGGQTGGTPVVFALLG